MPNKNGWKIALTMSALLLFTAHGHACETLLPGNATQGKKLHKASCTGCHNDSVYQRKKRTIQSVEGLQGRVKMCSNQVGAKFSDEQINDVVKYLNDNYYHF